MAQLLSKPAPQADVDDHVGRGVDHQQKMVDVATNQEKGRYMKFVSPMAMLKKKSNLKLGEKSNFFLLRVLQKAFGCHGEDC